MFQLERKQIYLKICRGIWGVLFSMIVHFNYAQPTYTDESIVVKGPQLRTGWGSSISVGDVATSSKTSINGFISMRVNYANAVRWSSAKEIHLKKRGAYHKSDIKIGFSRPISNISANSKNYMRDASAFARPTGWWYTHNPPTGLANISYSNSSRTINRGIVGTHSEITFGTRGQKRRCYHYFIGCVDRRTPFSNQWISQISYTFGPNEAWISNLAAKRLITQSNPDDAPLLSYTGQEYAAGIISFRIQMDYRDRDTGLVWFRGESSRDLRVLPFETISGDHTFGATGEYIFEQNDSYATDRVTNLPYQFLQKNNGPLYQNIPVFNYKIGMYTTHQVTMTGVRAPGFVWENMYMWYKSDPVMFNDSFTKPAVDRELISKWIDYSGNEFDLVQTSGFKQPIFNIGDNTINFHGTTAYLGNESMATNGTISPDLGATASPQIIVYSIFRPNTLTAGGVWGISDRQGTDRRLSSSNTATNIIGAGQSGDLAIPDLFIAKRSNMVGVIYDDGTIDGSSVRIKGTEVQRFTSNQSATNADFEIGNDGTGFNGFQGNISEVIVYKGTKKEQDLKKIETYFALKYGFTLPYNYVIAGVDSENDPDVVIYPYSKTFGSNIIGLAAYSTRQGFETKKSVSQEDGALITIDALEVVPETIVAGVDYSEPAFIPNTSVVMGHNNAALSLSTKNVPNNFARLQRIWRVANNRNANGQAFDVFNISFNVQDPRFDFIRSVNDGWALLISDTEDFSNAQVIDNTIIDGIKNKEAETITFLKAQMKDGQYFTIAQRGFFVSGTVYSDVGTTPVGKGIPVTIAKSIVDPVFLAGGNFVKVNPATNQVDADPSKNTAPEEHSELIVKVATSVTGEYVARLTSILDNDVITAFIDEQQNFKGVVVSNVPVGDSSYSGLDIYKNAVALRGEQQLPVSNRRLRLATSVPDADVTNFIGARFINNGDDADPTISALDNAAVTADPDDDNFELIIKNSFATVVPEQVIYKPDGHADFQGDLYINGTFDTEGANAGKKVAWQEFTYKLAGDWKINNSTGKFIEARSFIDFNGRDQAIYGNNTFFQLQKLITVQSQTLSFEEATTQIFLSDVILKGRDQDNRLLIRTIDANGTELNGIRAFINAQAPRYLGGVKVLNFDWLDVRDNENLNFLIIDPENSIDSGNTLNWFKPLVVWELKESAVNEDRGVPPDNIGDFNTHEYDIQLTSWSTDKTTGTISIIGGSTAVQGEDYDNIGRSISFAYYDIVTGYVRDNADNIITTVCTTGCNATTKPTDDELSAYFTANPRPTITLSVDIIADIFYEGDEKINLQIDETTVVNASVLDEEKDHVINILDNDPSPTVRLSLVNLTAPNQPLTEADQSVAEITATIVAATGVNTVVELEFNGDAVEGRDYLATSKQIVILAGSTSGSTTIKTVQDGIYENVETVEIGIANVINGQEDGTQITSTTIINNDPQPHVELMIADDEIEEDGGKTQVFAVLDQASEVETIVSINDTGVAIAGLDYTIAPKLLRIPAGGTRSDDALIVAIDDFESEPREAIDISIAGVINAIEANSQQVTTEIIDNDAFPENTTITADPVNILGDGVSKSKIKVTLFDENKMQLIRSGGEVVLTASSGSFGLDASGNPLTSIEAKDFNDGTYTADLTSEQLDAGSRLSVITVVVNNIPITATAEVTFNSRNDTDGDGIYDFCECPNPPNCADSDGDGFANFKDSDSDDDGILDSQECEDIGNTCSCPDTDKDGIKDYLEHNSRDVDGDGKTNFLDPDSDNDGKKDFAECGQFMECPDSDGDGILEHEDGDDRVGDPNGGDTDKDGLSDKDECPDGSPCVDTDSDGQPNYFDTDSDGLEPGDEASCPAGVCPDCDGDGLDVIQDTDDDNNGILDKDEIIYQNPSADLDGDGLENICDPDDDGDGILDKDECPDGVPCTQTCEKSGLPDFINQDSDCDGVKDQFECPTGAPCPDTNQNGIPDYRDTNSDSDNIPDIIECEGANGGSCPDVDGDGLPNNLDPDSNGNGIPDEIEGLSDCDKDGIPAFRDLSEKCPNLIKKVGIFTPNGDDNNDFWYIEGIEKFPGNTVTVFNRLGSTVYFVEDYNNTDPSKRFAGFRSMNNIELKKEKQLLKGTYFFTITLGEDNLDPVSGYVMIK